MRRLTLSLSLFFALLIYVMAIAPRVHATFPGTNDADGSTANVFVGNPDGSNPQQVQLTNPAEQFGVPIWSPDGTEILISHTIRCDNLGNCLFQPATVKPDGTEFNQLVPPNPPDSTSAGIDCNAWSRDGTLILCGFAGDVPGVFSIRASDGGDPVRLTTYPFGPNCNACDDPQDVSPDGSQFVFLRFRRENFGTTPAVTEQVALFVENTDGTGLRQLTPYGVAAPHERSSAKWSPDGTQIISGMHNGNLFVVRLNGTGLNTIKLQVGTQKYSAFEPHFSPDGTRIIFGMFINGGEGIYTANPDGSDVKQVTFTMDFSMLFNGPDWGTHPVQ